MGYHMFSAPLFHFTTARKIYLTFKMCTFDHVSLDGFDCDYLKGLLMFSLKHLSELTISDLILKDILIDDFGHNIK